MITALVFIAGLSVGSMFGLLVAGLLQAARYNSEDVYERGNRAVDLVHGDGSDNRGAAPGE